MSRECLFCDIVAGTIPSVEVAEDDKTYAFMDVDPGSDGHLLHGGLKLSASGCVTTSPVRDEGGEMELLLR